MHDMTIGERLAHYRRLSNLSAQQLSDKTGGSISRAVIANIESGRREDVTVNELITLSYALGVPPAALALDLTNPVLDHDLMGSTFVTWFLGEEVDPLTRNAATSAAWSLIQAHRNMRKTERRYQELLKTAQSIEDESLKVQRQFMWQAGQNLRDLGVVSYPYEDDDVIEFGSDG